MVDFEKVRDFENMGDFLKLNFWTEFENFYHCETKARY